METPSPLSEMLAFTLEKAEAEPALRRALLCRGLAVACGDQADAGALNAAAVHLEKAEALCRDLKVRFSQENKQP